MNKETRELDKGIREIVGVFTDPIIVMPGGWGDDLPDWLREAITLERLISNVENLKTGRMTATDAEACAYLFTACLSAPPSHDWAQIYFYVAGKVILSHRKKDEGAEMPADIRVTELTRNQQDDLNRLKRWIYEAREKHRKEKERGVRKADKEEKERQAPKVVQHTFKLD